MIEYDYILKQDMKSQIAEYPPAFRKKIEKNVAKLVGHNSSGKSTLLNFIAISAHGLDNRVEMTPPLRQRIEDIYESEDSDFEFEMLVDNTYSNTALKFTVSKQGHIGKNNKSKVIKIEESINRSDFKELPKESFLKKYRLIYDMPDRPMERIQELIKETERAEKKCQENVRNLKNTLRDLVGEINRSKDQGKIDETKRKLDSAKIELKEKEKQHIDAKILHDKLKRLYGAVNIKEKHSKYRAEFSEYNQKSKNKEEGKKRDKKAYAVYSANVRSIETSLEYSKNLQAMSMNKLNNLNLDSKKLTLWSNFKIDKNEFFQTKTIPVGFFMAAQDVEEEIDKHYHSEENKVQDGKKKILERIMDVLKPHLDDDLSILDKSMKDLYDALKGEIESIYESVKIYNLAMEAKSDVVSSRRHAKKAEELILKLGPKPESDDDDPECLIELKGSVDKLYNDLKSAINEASAEGITEDNYEIVLKELRRDLFLEKYIDSTAAHISENLRLSTATYQRLGEEINGSNGLVKKVTKLETIWEGLTDAKDHEMKEYSSELSILEKELDIISSDLSKKNDILNAVIDSKLKKIEPDQIQFLKLVWSNLGQRLGTVQHARKNYDVRNVNMIERHIEAMDGTLIKFSHMGTGESQMAYLMGLLNTTDDKVLIALFDEVDHMDPTVIRSVQDKLWDLHTQGKLIIGLMAAPGISTEVEYYERS